MMKNNALLAFVGALLLVLALAVNPTPGLGAEKHVTYLSLADYTGPIAGLNVPADMGCEDYFKYINERGGVQGIKVKFIGVDTRYDVARGVSAYKRYRRAHKLLVANAINTGLGKALVPLIKRDKLIMLAAGEGEAQAHIGYTFLWGQCYQDAFGAALDWMVEDWQKKGNSGTPVVGFMSWDNPYGREPLKGGKEYAEKIGVKLLPPEFFPPGSLKHDVWLTRLAKGGANYIYVGGVDPTPTNVVRDAYALGLTKKIQMVCDFWGPAMGVGVKAHPKELEGAVVTVYYLRGTDAFKHPMAKLWTKYRKTPISQMPPNYLSGQAWGMAYEEGLKIALKDVGYDKLNGEAMYRAYQKLTGRKIFQGIQGPCAYSPTSRLGSKEIKFYRVTDGKVVPITDWRVAPATVSLYKKW
jgi:branched-chain amino acid transport system substrate-binding protein